MIVVDVDGSSGSDRAVAWALEEARTRGGSPVELVHAWSLAVGGHAAEARALAQLEAASQALLDRAVAAARAASEGIEVTGTLVLGHPAHRLAERSADAELLVVGSRGHVGCRRWCFGRWPTPASGTPRARSWSCRPRINDDNEHR